MTRLLLVVQAEDSTTEFGSLMGKMQGIVWDLSHAKSTVDCVWDPTLHLGALGKSEHGGTGIYMISALPWLALCNLLDPKASLTC